MSLPLVEELAGCPDVMDALEAFADQPGLLLLDSALVRGSLGRYSFLGADPFERVVVQRAQFGAPYLEELRGKLSQFSAEPIPGLPPFQGGAAGLLSYEFGTTFERIARARMDEFGLPDLAVGFYDWVLAWDHVARRAWIVSHGFPSRTNSDRFARAAARLQFVKSRLQARPGERSIQSGFKSALPIERLAPQHPLTQAPELTSDFSRTGYMQGVARIIEYIHAGDVFQANLSQRLLVPQKIDSVTLARRLQRENPAPLAGYLAFDDWTVVSASPERFVSLRGGEVETRPIKGTRQRRTLPEADLFTRDELRESTKDRAENVMIVDLLRNDLSRVCRPGSLRVPQLCTVETFETVQHLVSEVRGLLEPDKDAWDVLRAAFPGGSITGAPKVRAMQIIAEQEPTVRGPYCGSLFYVGFDSNADSNILIRTFVCRRGWIQCGVGGGIVADSDPESEYEETLHKAAGMLRALN